MPQEPLNAWILAACRALPPGGGYRFTPTPRDATSPVNPRDPHYDGVKADVLVGGEVVARSADDGATYCCGVTFEVYASAWRAATGADAPPGIDAAEARALVAEWFCPTMGHAGAVDAVVRRGLGVRVGEDEARPGDLCQFWRRTRLDSPSGHSVIFLGWERAADGARRIRYFSSQPATGGIGEHVETVGPEWEIHLARAHHRR